MRIYLFTILFILIGALIPALGLCEDSIEHLDLTDAELAICKSFRQKDGAERVSEGNALSAIFVQRYTTKNGVQWLKEPVLRHRPLKKQLIMLLGEPTSKSEDIWVYDLGQIDLVRGRAYVTFENDQLTDFSILTNW